MHFSFQFEMVDEHPNADESLFLYQEVRRSHAYSNELDQRAEAVNSWLNQGCPDIDFPFTPREFLYGVARYMQYKTSRWEKSHIDVPGGRISLKTFNEEVYKLVRDLKDQDMSTFDYAKYFGAHRNKLADPLKLAQRFSNAVYAD